MDRFIVPQGVDYEQNILPLKSNMDRFIVFTEQTANPGDVPLKSNMDRFIAARFSKA